MSKSKIALITGANRGLGFEIARQLSKNHNFEVILGIRNQTKAQEALKMLKIENLNVDYFQLDITSEESVLDFKNWFLVSSFLYLVSNFGAISVLLTLIESHLKQFKRFFFFNFS